MEKVPAKLKWTLKTLRNDRKLSKFVLNFAYFFYPYMQNIFTIFLYNKYS